MGIPESQASSTISIPLKTPDGLHYITCRLEATKYYDSFEIHTIQLKYSIYLVTDSNPSLMNSFQAFCQFKPIRARKYLDMNIKVDRSQLFTRVNQTTIQFYRSHLLNDRCIDVQCFTVDYTVSGSFSISFNYSIQMNGVKPIYPKYTNSYFQILFHFYYPSKNITSTWCKKQNFINYNLEAKEVQIQNSIPPGHYSVFCGFEEFRIFFQHPFLIDKNTLTVEIYPRTPQFHYMSQSKVFCLVYPLYVIPFYDFTFQVVDNKHNIRHSYADKLYNLSIVVKSSVYYHLVNLCFMCKHDYGQQTRCYILKANVTLLYTPNYPKYYSDYFPYTIKAYFHNNYDNTNLKAFCSSANTQVTVTNDVIHLPRYLTANSVIINCNFTPIMFKDNFTLHISKEILKLSILPDKATWYSPFQLDFKCIISDPLAVNHSDSIRIQQTPFVVLETNKMKAHLIGNCSKNEMCVLCGKIGILLIKHCYRIFYIRNITFTIFPLPTITMIKYHKRRVTCSIPNLNSIEIKFRNITLKKLPNGSVEIVDLRTTSITSLLVGLPDEISYYQCSIYVFLSNRPTVTEYIANKFKVIVIDPYRIGVIANVKRLIKVKLELYFKCLWNIPYSKRLFHHTDHLKDKTLICVIFLRPSTLIQIVQEDFVKLKDGDYQLMFKRIPVHNVYVVGSDALFRCYVLPDRVRYFIPYPIFRDSVLGASKNEICLHDTIYLSNNTQIGNISFLCQVPYFEKFIKKGYSIHVIDKKVWLHYLNRTRTVYIAGGNSMITCLREPAVFRYDNTYLNKYRDIAFLNPSAGLLSLARVQLNYYEGTIECYCDVYTGFTINATRFVIILKRDMVILMVLNSRDRAMFLGEKAQIKCIAGLPYKANKEETIKFSWKPKSNLILSSVDNFLYVLGNDVAGEYNQTCVMYINNQLFQIDYGIYIIDVSYIELLNFTTHNRKVFLNIEDIDAWCELIPRALQKYLPDPHPSIRIKGENRHLFKKIHLRPRDYLNETIYFYCNITFSGRIFSKSFNIYILDSNFVRAVFDPQKYLYPKPSSGASIKLFDCILIPVVLESKKYFSSTFAKLKGPDDLITHNEGIWSTSYNWTAIYNYACSFTIVGRKYTTQSPFVVVLERELEIDMFIKSFYTFSLNHVSFFNDKDNVLLFRFKPREIIIDKKVQFSFAFSEHPNKDSMIFKYDAMLFTRFISRGDYYFNIYFKLFHKTIWLNFTITIMDLRYIYLSMVPNHNIVVLQNEAIENTSCEIHPDFMSNTTSVHIIAGGSYSGFYITNLTIMVNETVEMGEFIFYCIYQQNAIFKSIIFHISVLVCPGGIIPLPIQRNIFIGDILKCIPNVSYITISLSFNFQLYRMEETDRYGNCSMNQPARLISPVRIINGMKLGKFLVNCKLEFICVINYFAGYTLLQQSNQSFVRQLISNISIEFFPDKETFYVDDKLLCRLKENLHSNETVNITMTIMSDNDRLVDKNIFIVKQSTAGGHYTFRCNYTTKFGEIRMITKDILIIIAPYRLWIDNYTTVVDKPIICKSNGYPQQSYRYYWKFISGPSDFIFVYKNRLYFEALANFGHYNISCSVTTSYDNYSFYLEKTFTVTLTGFAKPIQFEVFDTKSTDWIGKIWISWLLLYHLTFLGLARYITWSRAVITFNGFGFAKTFKERLLYPEFVIKFEPHTQLTFHSITTNLILISHYYVPTEDDEFYIEYNQNILEDPFTRDTTYEELEPLYKLMGLFNKGILVHSTDEIADELTEMIASSSKTQYYRMSMAEYDIKRSHRYETFYG